MLPVFWFVCFVFRHVLLLCSCSLVVWCHTVINLSRNIPATDRFDSCPSEPTLFAIRNVIPLSHQLVGDCWVLLGLLSSLCVVAMGCGAAHQDDPQSISHFSKLRRTKLVCGAWMDRTTGPWHLSLLLYIKVDSKLPAASIKSSKFIGGFAIGLLVEKHPRRMSSVTPSNQAWLLCMHALGHNQKG